MTNNKQSIRNYKPLPTQILVVFGNHGSLNALGKVDVNLLLMNKAVSAEDQASFD